MAILCDLSHKCPVRQLLINRRNVHIFHCADWDYCYSGPSTTHTPLVPPAQQPSPTPLTHSTPSNWSPPWNGPTVNAPTHWWTTYNPYLSGWNPTPWTGNYPATPSTITTPSGQLISSSVGGCGSKGCKECEGDCDSDSDCKGNLECFQRDGLGAVPGCGSGGMEGKNFGLVEGYG